MAVPGLLRGGPGHRGHPGNLFWLRVQDRGEEKTEKEVFSPYRQISNLPERKNPIILTTQKVQDSKTQRGYITLTWVTAAFS